MFNLLFAALSCAAPALFSEPLAHETISSATVVADRGVVASRQDTVLVNPVNPATSALLALPALQISDYGGAGGLKSVSLRGLGVTHTSFYVDGLRVGNVQSGQADLGSFEIENTSSISVDYAQNSVELTTARPTFAEGLRYLTDAFIAYGSFNTLQAFAKYSYKLSERTSVSAHLSGLSTDGDFPYGKDLKRSNNDLRQYRGGVDIFGRDWHVKAGINDAERGTPGSTTYPGTDRQQDRNSFVQGTYRQLLSPLYEVKLSARAAADDLLYKSDWGEDEYKQKELQLNSTQLFHTAPWLDLSLTADWWWDSLESSLYDGGRNTVLAGAAALFKLERLQASAGLRWTLAYDRHADTRKPLEPQMQLRYQLPLGFELTAFARRAYRLPTFNELYYPGYGNPELKAEDARLYDAGIQWFDEVGKWSLTAKLDGFYNDLRDKITSAPTPSDPSIWLPFNVGHLKVPGADASFSARYGGAEFALGLTAHYSYLGEDVPYTPRSSASIGGDCKYKGWSAELLWALRGSNKDAYGGRYEGWNTVDLTLCRALFRDRLVVSVIGRNLFDYRYMVVNGYPMQGRSLLLALKTSF